MTSRRARFRLSLTNSLARFENELIATCISRVRSEVQEDLHAEMMCIVIYTIDWPLDNLRQTVVQEVCLGIE